MISCNNCNVIVTKINFCSDKCRVDYNRRQKRNASVTTSIPLVTESLPPSTFGPRTAGMAVGNIKDGWKPAPNLSKEYFTSKGSKRK